MGEDHVASAHDDRAHAVSVEGPSHIRCPTSLAAEAGHEQPGVGHGGAKIVELFGPGGADDGAHGAESSARCGADRQVLHASGDMLVRGLPVADEFLEVLAAGVRGLHEHEDPGAPALGRLHEGLDGVEAEVGVYGEGVGGPWSGEPTVGVGFGGRADVAAFAIGEHEQVFRPRVGDHVGQRDHAVGAEGLEAGELRLDDRHQRRDHVDHVAAEAGEDPGEGLRVGDRGRGQRRRERFPPRVEADAGRRAAGLDGRGDPVGEAAVSREVRGRGGHRGGLR